MSEDAALAPPEKKKRKKKKKRAPVPIDFDPAAEARRLWLRRASIGVAAFYLLTVWLDGIGSNLPSKLLPRAWVYFAQIAALFPHASPRVIDYRAEGWSCTERKWEEIDVRPYFKIDQDNKENRFQRALQFYRRNRAVMRALDDFVVQRWNDGHDKIGGVRFLSLRIPYPKPAERVRAYQWEPLSHYPQEQRHDWYWTPKSRRAERCGYTLPPKPPAGDREARHDDEPDEAPASKPDAKEPEP